MPLDPKTVTKPANPSQPTKKVPASRGPKAEPSPKQGKPDWERIEGDYRAGLLSLREIATRDGNVTEGAIRKKAKTNGWERDLGARIQARAEALVRKAEVRKVSTQLSPADERTVVEVNAQVIAQVRGEHRADITRGRSLVLQLLTELEQQTANRELFEELGELMRREDDKGVDKLNDLYTKVIALPGRIDGMKKLTESLKGLIALEREAYGLSSDGGGSPPPDRPPSSLTPDEAYLVMVQGAK